VLLLTAPVPSHKTIALHKATSPSTPYKNNNKQKKKNKNKNNAKGYNINQP
jgi:hypothetical protein